MSEIEEEIIEEDEQFKGKTYKQILEELERLRKVTAKTYVPALCLAKVRENPTTRNIDIREQVMKDCLKIGLWTKRTIMSYFPKWVTRKYSDKKKLRETRNSPVEQVREQIIAVFGQTLDNIEQELETAEQKEEEEEAGGISYDTGSVKEPKSDLPSPTKLYESGVKAASRLWKNLTNTGKLTAANTVDVLNDHIKPSREFRLRLLKGLDPYEYAHYQRVLIWTDRMIQDTLRLCQEINKEQKATVTK
jgi:hypothetical protein